jgi:hypothetical protein
MCLAADARFKQMRLQLILTRAQNEKLYGKGYGDPCP